MLRVVKPIPFTLGQLVSSTAVDEPTWSTPPYDLNDVVVYPDPVTGLPRNWKSLVSINSATPGTDATKWQNIGPSNKTAMFDDRMSTQTTHSTTDLVIEFAPGNVASVIGLLNIAGSTVTLEVFEGATLVSTQTVNILQETVLDWFQYFTAPFEPVTRVIFENLAIYYSTTVRITVTGANTAIGHLVVGAVHEIGAVKYGATSGLIDYSLKETDEEFGGTVFTERDFADENTFGIRLPKSELNRVKYLLRNLRATPCLWLGSEETVYTETLVVFGWYRSHTIVVEFFDESAMDIEIEGLA